MGMLTPGDTLVALSYSGETEEILRLLDRVKRLRIPLISMTGGRNSTLASRTSDTESSERRCTPKISPRIWI